VLVSKYFALQNVFSIVSHVNVARPVPKPYILEIGSSDEKLIPNFSYLYGLKEKVDMGK